MTCCTVSRLSPTFHTPPFPSLCCCRREQGVCGQAASIVVEGVQVSLPSYEEAVYGSGGAAAPPPESRVNIVLSEGPQTEPPASELSQSRPEHSLPSTSTAARSGHAETVLVHQDPSSSSPSSSSSCTWVSEQRGAAGAGARRPSSTSSDQHSLLSLTSVEEYGDGTLGFFLLLFFRSFLSMTISRHECIHTILMLMSELI